MKKIKSHEIFQIKWISAKKKKKKGNVNFLFAKVKFSNVNSKVLSKDFFEKFNNKESV